MRIAAVQMISGANINDNLQAADRLLRQAASEGAELAVLPENFACYGRGDLRNEGERESRDQGPILPFLRERARELNLWLVGGTLPLIHPAAGSGMADGRRVYAACCVFDAHGQCVGRYDKSHLFDAEVSDGVGTYKESTYLCPGTGPQVVESPWGRLGLSVCYDLRFPEHYRELRAAGADILLVPSAFTYATGKAHWDILLRARAIENQCFVVAANQGGRHDDRRHSYGGSVIVHPWGQILAQKGQGEFLVVAELDMDEVRECRRRMPMGGT
jgi:predicted amidohydrolase